MGLAETDKTGYLADTEVVGQGCSLLPFLLLDRYTYPYCETTMMNYIHKNEIQHYCIKKKNHSDM